MSTDPLLRPAVTLWTSVGPQQGRLYEAQKSTILFAWKDSGLGQSPLRHDSMYLYCTQHTYLVLEINPPTRWKRMFLITTVSHINSLGKRFNFTYECDEIIYRATSIWAQWLVGSWVSSNFYHSGKKYNPRVVFQCFEVVCGSLDTCLAMCNVHVVSMWDRSVEWYLFTAQETGKSSRM